MFKLIKKLVVIALLGIVGLILFKAQGRPTQLIPYPYTIKSNNLTPPPDLEEADVLILGDTMGLSFGPYQELLVKTASQGLARELKVVNWAWTNEGLHRTLAKLKSLPKLPKVVLYFGGSDELKETPFYIDSHKEILRNFELYSKPRVATAVTLLPVTSRLLFLSHPLKVIDEFEAATREKKPDVYQKKLEIHYKLFELELSDFVAHVRKMGSTPLLMTYPINLELRPKEVCNNSQDGQIAALLSQKEAMIKAKKYKEAYADLKKLASDLIANADAWYLLGVAAKNLGNRNDAIHAFTRAQTFDCDSIYSGPVFNAIVRKIANERGVFLIDFDRMMEGIFERGDLFLTDRFPQNIFYQALAKDTAKVFRQVFDLN